jgi:hypothetical protein
MSGGQRSLAVARCQAQKVIGRRALQRPPSRNPVSFTVGRATMVLLTRLIEQLQLKAAVAAGAATRKTKGAQTQAAVADTPLKRVPTTKKGVRARWRGPPPRRRPLPSRPHRSRPTLEAGGSGRADEKPADQRPFWVLEGQGHLGPRSSSEHGGRRRPLCRPPDAGRSPRRVDRARPLMKTVSAPFMVSLEIPSLGSPF